MPPVSDGFQPSSPPRSNREPDPTSQPALSLARPIGRRSVALQPNSNQTGESSQKQPQPHRNALQQTGSGLARRNSFSLRHDAQNSDMPRRIPSIASSVTSESFARPMSYAGTSATPRAQSPFHGPNAPSHPYGAYPQSTLNRSSTISSVRPVERPFSGSRRPTHPYGMYPQDTSAGTDAMLESADIANVGFPGLRQQYRRRIGPDGEEADDIIGPDGHAEQLPPYTRYPEAEPLPQKEAAAAAAQPAAPPSPARPRSATEPPRTAATDASASDQLLPNAAPQTPSTTAVSSTKAASEEVPTIKEKWTERSKKRVCGGKLPRWAVVLLFVLTMMIAATVGGVIGKTLPRKNASQAPGSPKQDSDPAVNTNGS